MVKKTEDIPHDRLTRMGAAMIEVFNTHEELGTTDRAIVFLKDHISGGIAIAGYDGDDKEAIMDLIVHLRAMFRANGHDLHFVPVGDTPPKDQA